jgi:hypothetical protein
MGDFEPKPTKPTGPWWASEAWKGHYFPQVGDFFLLTKNSHPVGCAKVNKNSCGVWIDGICKNNHFTDEKVTPGVGGTLDSVIFKIHYCKAVLMDPPTGKCDRKPCRCWNKSLWEENHPSMPETEYVPDEEELEYVTDDDTPETEYVPDEEEATETEYVPDDEEATESEDDSSCHEQ